MNPPSLQYEPALILYSRKTWKSKSFTFASRLAATHRRKFAGVPPKRTDEGRSWLERLPCTRRATFILHETSFRLRAGGSTPNGDITTDSNAYHLYYYFTTAIIDAVHQSC
jgi:hypothetical protein